MVARPARAPVVIRGPMADRLYLPIKEGRWEDIPPELCFWGGAGTGKSFTLMLILVLLMRDPSIGGLRILWCRKTRKSITNSSIVTYRKVLESLGLTMSSKPTPAQRQSEVFHTPAGTNELVWMTLEDPENAFSAEYDIVCFEEAIQTTEGTYETAAGRCLRNNAIPAQFVVSLTNPGSKHGWIYKRMFGQKKQMASCRTTIEDNPYFFDVATRRLTDRGRDYIGKLSHIYTGTRLLRLLKGEWVSEEGWIFEGLWDDDRHTFEGAFVRRPYQKPLLTIQGEHPSLPAHVEIEWTFGSMDYGFRNAGTLYAWGVDAKGRIYMLDEVYHTQRDRDWWVERVIDFSDLYKFDVVVTDHDPERHVHWNRTIAERLPERAKTPDGEPFIRNCEKSRGEKDANKVDVVRTLLQDAPDGNPRCYLMRGARRHAPDPNLVEQHLPHCLEQEVPQLVWKSLADNKVGEKNPEEKIEDGRANHGFDAWVYAGRYVAGRDLDVNWEEGKPEYERGSFEHHMAIQESKWERDSA